MGQQFAVYEKLFEIAHNNALSNKINLGFSFEAFRNIIYKNPADINVNEFIEMGRGDFVTSAYLRCLNRLPNNNDWEKIDKISKKLNGEEMAVRYMVMRMLTRKREFRKLNKVLDGITVLKEDILRRNGRRLIIKISYLEILDGIWYLIWTYGGGIIWDNLTDDLKNKIRKLLGREKK